MKMGKKHIADNFPLRNLLDNYYLFQTIIIIKV